MIIIPGYPGYRIRGWGWLAMIIIINQPKASDRPSSDCADQMQAAEMPRTIVLAPMDC